MIGVKSYIKEAIKTFLSRGVTSPGKSRLFDVTEGEEKLIEENTKTFHLTVAKLFWIVKRSWLDIEITMYFLCTRVKDPYRYDLGKLRLVLQFLNQTIGGDCIIGSDNIYEMLTYKDTSYTPHDDMRGHTSSCMTFGWGLIHAKSSKQKLNTKISKELQHVYYMVGYVYGTSRVYIQTKITRSG